MTTKLFSPLKLGALTIPNRIIVSPMCQYSAEDGLATDWHKIHWAGMALSGAGLVMIEATAVSPEGRITPNCLGLWDEATAAKFARTLDEARRQAPATFGVQLAHAGRKASSLRPWDGPGHAAPDNGGWRVVAPSAVAFAENWPVPSSLTEAGIEQVIADFASAAQRAVGAGVATIEIHAAHGYLLSSFLSPLANHRSDRWGGSFENRSRLALEVLRAVRMAVPADLPVGIRMNGTDWKQGGIVPDEAVALARAARDLGCDYVDVSSGGNALASIPVGPGYQVPFASRIRRETGITTVAVGMIRSPLHAEALVAGGDVDAIALGRAILNNPRWPWHAAETLGVSMEVAPQYRFGATSQYLPTFGR